MNPVRPYRKHLALLLLCTLLSIPGPLPAFSDAAVETARKGDHKGTPLLEKAHDDDANELAGAQITPPLPFYDGFESGVLLPHWATYTTAQGRVLIAPLYAQSGLFSALLDDQITDNTFSHAAIVLTLDLANLPNVDLDFWWREFGIDGWEENGLFISNNDGVEWHRTYPFTYTQRSYIQVTLDLDEAAAAAGMSLNENFQIKFQFYDNWPIPPSGLPGDGLAIDEIRIDTDPRTPTDLIATATSPEQIGLAWTDRSENESGFWIERSLDGSSGWVEIASVGANVTGYPDTDVVAGTRYYYRVRAYDTPGESHSAYSNVDWATIEVCYLPAVLRKAR